MNSTMINPQILGEAADWLVQLHSGTATPSDHQAIAHWRSRSAEHAQAWLRAEALLGEFRNVPANLAIQTLQRASRKEGLSRRQTLTRVGLFLMAGPLGFASQHMPWQQWTADQRTAVGEQKRLQLPDGSEVLLNTESAVNIAFNGLERRVMLLANNMRLDELLGELSRYRPGVLRCHADVAGLRVSGAFSLRDTDASLRLLSDTLPLKISSLTRYWLSVEPRV